MNKRKIKKKLGQRIYKSRGKNEETRRNDEKCFFRIESSRTPFSCAYSHESIASSGTVSGSKKFPNPSKPSQPKPFSNPDRKCSWKEGTSSVFSFLKLYPKCVCPRI